MNKKIETNNFEQNINLKEKLVNNDIEGALKALEQISRDELEFKEDNYILSLKLELFQEDPEIKRWILDILDRQLVFDR